MVDSGQVYSVPTSLSIEDGVIMDDMEFLPPEGQYLVDVMGKAEKKVGSIIIADVTGGANVVSRGVIIARGPGQMLPSGEWSRLQYEVGTEILVIAMSHHRRIPGGHKYGGRKLTLVPSADVICGVRRGK